MTHNKFHAYSVNLGMSVADCIHYTSNVNPITYVDDHVNNIVVPDILQADVLSVIL